MQNTLFYGDNLDILAQFVDDATVDLVYLDPPFNSNRDYNVLFREQSGAAAWADFPALCPNAKAIELMRGFHNTPAHRHRPVVPAFDPVMRRSVATSFD